MDNTRWPARRCSTQAGPSQFRSDICKQTLPVARVKLAHASGVVLIRSVSLIAWLKLISQAALGGLLLSAGISHLTVSRLEFQAQVPTWLPLDPDFVVVSSGIVEILLGVALLALCRFRVRVGMVTALFFLAIFPGTISQFVNGIDAFGLNTGQARAIRLLLQPVLILWALWSTGACRRS